ncbi:MAG: response regulator [Silvibacterium sp.]|nr:response regulator [Silvibacterium sp.]
MRSATLPVGQTSRQSSNADTFMHDEFFAGGGEMGALMRAFDWSSTPLGHPFDWPPTLQTMTKLLLANSFPILLWWGPDFIQLYNDAYIPVLGNKHPHAALGKPFRECWSEVYRVLGPLAESPFEGGPATWIEDIPVEVNRYGYQEEAHFTISYSPVPDATAPRGIGGVIAIVHEISEKIVGDRRTLVLRDLGSRSAETGTAEEACANAVTTLASYSKDAPFAMVYLLDGKGEFAHLAGKAGTEGCDALCPELISLRDESAIWPFELCRRREDIVVVDDLAHRFDRLPPGPWRDPPDSAAVVPLKSNLPHQLAGFLVAGISSRLKFDDDYRGFLELASTQIATAIASAQAYENERRKNEALAELDRAKTAFFSNVSHEFRTPLTLMMGPLEDMLAEEEELSASSRQRLEFAHRNSLRLLKLVNTLLDFSRIEAGRIQASFEPADLSLLTAELASLFRSIIERAGLKLTVDCPPLGEMVYVDREMWEKIVFNLLSNAFKFTFEGEIGISMQLRNSAVEVTVSDTGTGIPPEEVPELFKRFHRIRGARGRSYEGSGIGLALVQELVRLHGGSVRIESELGRGSKFILSLPLGISHLPADRIGGARPPGSTALTAEAYVHEAERWLANAPPSATDDGTFEETTLLTEPTADKEVLVIADDNADMRDYLSRLLDKHYRVYTASDGLGAIQAVKQLRPSLVIADVMMAGLDGFAVLRAIRGNTDVSGTPVILLSARAGEESRVEGLQAGADDYMVKPFSARELLVRVESHLALSRLRRKTENQVRESEMRFRALAAASSDVHYRMSPDWSEMRQLRGRDFMADEGEPDCGWLQKYIHPDDRPRVMAAIGESIRTKSVFELEHRVLRVDGSQGWSYSRAVPLLDGSGELVEWFGAATDITARKQAQEALIRSEKLASLGRMAATIAHEINNPLEALTNLVFIALNMSDLPESARQNLEMAEAELKRVAHITRQSLGFYRESNAPALTSINALLESAIDLLKGKISSKRAIIQNEWRADVNTVAVAGELRQVFSNLLTNSLDALDEQGRIRIRVSARSGEGTQRVRITISDNGRGIGRMSREHLFEPFFTTKGTVGTGLGLWAAKQIIEKHHGTIQMKSQDYGERRGTVFSIVLPIYPESTVPLDELARAGAPV